MPNWKKKVDLRKNGVEISLFFFKPKYRKMPVSYISWTLRIWYLKLSARDTWSIPAASWHESMAGPKKERQNQTFVLVSRRAGAPHGATFGWQAHALKVGSTWIYVALLSHLLCLWITEVLRLQGHDFDLKNGTCRVKALKSSRACHQAHLEYNPTVSEEIKSYWNEQTNWVKLVFL